MVDVAVIVPTYREAANLPLLVPRVDAALKAAGLSYELIVVDDNSPDETPAVCAELAKQYSVRLEVRKTERGLSSAVVHGLDRADARILLVMDADLSHPPEKVPELVAALEEPGVDFVIGSRYVAGGKTDEKWSWFRRLNSQAATLLARPFTTAADPMAGFFALRRETYEAAEKLSPIGYKIGLELLVKCGCKEIREVPIDFADRILGESKLSLKEQINYVRHIGRLLEYRYPLTTALFKFMAVGATGMVVDLGTLAILLTFLTYPVGRWIAIAVAMTWNFALNRAITFRDAQPRPIWQQYLLFCGSCAAGALVNYFTSRGLVQTGWPIVGGPLPAAACGVVAGTAFNFLLCRLIAFPVPGIEGSLKAATTTEEKPANRARV
jgi:dolichol-phosphate mannosyltransferase